MSKLTIDPSKVNNGRLVEGAYAEDSSFTSVVIPEGITDIGEVAFYGCSNLREVVFPESLRFIREEAFGETAIEEVLLPAGMELIAEKAFFSCDDLRKIEVPGVSTVIESDAFSCCDDLHEGFIACGYPDNIRHHEELQYTLLWCSCPERHSSSTAERARAFIHKHEQLMIEWIIKHNNIPAMNGIARLGLLEGDLDAYIQQAHSAGRSEITALLMSVPRRFDEGEFDL